MTIEVKNLIERKQAEIDLMIELLEILCKIDEIGEPTNCMTIFSDGQNVYYANDIIEGILKEYF